MKNKKILLLVAMTAALSFSMTACSFGGGDEEVVVTPTPEPAPEPTEAPEPTPTIAPNIQDTTYTTADQSLSIELPDATWANTMDDGSTISFESPQQGKIRILHGVGEEALSTYIVPTTEDTANTLEMGAGFEPAVDYAISQFTANDVNGVGVYDYVVEYLNTEKSGGYSYAIKRVIANAQEYYEITASVVAKDEAALATAKAAMDSVQILGESTLKAATGGEAAGTDGAAAGEATSDLPNGGISDEALVDTNQTRTIYRNSDGQPLVVKNDGTGVWKDDAGNTYDFRDNGMDVYDQNDVDYYYHGEAADVYYMPVPTE